MCQIYIEIVKSYQKMKDVVFETINLNKQVEVKKNAKSLVLISLLTMKNFLNISTELIL
ncbi:unnamed protein product [Paramecium sonneborni]|uniref:Uncharacterized protein n=1 Tax=Paramecium sonneborni TaxID=65129 RepID=A0A8S1RNB3_9CILI|nr:unnamed protein product [Paramecium sonneborni]